MGVAIHGHFRAECQKNVLLKRTDGQVLNLERVNVNVEKCFKEETILLEFTN